MKTQTGPRGRAADPSSARNIARYLVGLRPVLTDACSVRADWVHRLGVLMADAKTGNAMRVTQGAGTLGREFGQKFRAVRSRITPSMFARLPGATTGLTARRCSSCFGGSMRIKLGRSMSFGWSSIAMPP